MVCDAHGHLMGALPIEVSDWMPMSFLQELTTVGMFGEKFDDFVQGAVAICVLFDLDHDDRTLGLQHIRGPLKHRELMTLDINFEEPDIVEFEVIECARVNRLLTPT